MIQWDSSLIDRIYADKVREKSEDRDNLLQLTSKRLYGDKVHYALELIQNAEDEGSGTIRFFFDEDSAIVTNDGRPFEENDVQGICSVKPGRKKNKIGFFGIGFKSVFNITKMPQIISGIYNFTIENYIYPKPKSKLSGIAKENYATDKGAIFILPFSPGMPTSQELIDDFKLLDSKILLFLENLHKLEFHDNFRDVHWIIERRPGEGSEIILTDGRQDEEFSETKWRVFHKDISVKDKTIVPEGKEGIAETRITIAIPIDTDTREAVQQKGVLYCYLPTKKRTDLNFLLQADFLPTIGRENVPDHPWNEWLIKELGKWAADVFVSIKDDEQLGSFLYEYIPKKEEIQDELIEEFYSELSNRLKLRTIAKTTHGWVKPERCAIQDESILRNIINESDLKILFHKRLNYVDPNISMKTEYTRAERILFELGAREIDARCAINLIKLERPLISKSLLWYLNLYEYLSIEFNTTGKSYSGDYTVGWDEGKKALFEELKYVNFILTNNKKLVPLKDNTKPDRLICYPQSNDLSEVEQLFTEGEIVFLHTSLQESTIIHRRIKDLEEEQKRSKIKDWFDDIGVRKYFKQAHIIREVILPKFATTKYMDYDDRKLYQFTNYIRTHWSTIEAEIRNKNFSVGFTDEIKNTIKLKAFRYENHRKINEYKKPDELYFSNRYGKNETMELLFNGIEEVFFLAPYYIDREQTQAKIKKTRGRQREQYSWKKFAEILGVWASPRVSKTKEKIRTYTGDVEWIEREYSTQGHFVSGDSYCTDIEKIIEHCSSIDDFKENQLRLTILWDSLAKNWKLYKENQYCQTKYHWFYYSDQRKVLETSTFLEYLRNAQWVLGSDNGFHRPSDLFIDTTKNQQLLGDSAIFLELKANDMFLRDIKINFEPSCDVVMEELYKFRKLNNKPETNQVKKMETIYRFLSDAVNEIKDSAEHNTKVLNLVIYFNQNELLYLPREDKTWWKPSNAFWRDFSDHFGIYRGYVEHQGKQIYNANLMSFFNLIGMKEQPSLADSIEMLEEHKKSEDLNLYKKYAPNIYQYIESIIEDDNFNEEVFNHPVFLSNKNTFPSLLDLYYVDDEEFGDYFKDDIEVLWLPYSWANLEKMLALGNFNRISDCLQIKKKLGPLNEVDGENSERLRKFLHFALIYLKKRAFNVFEELEKQNIRHEIEALEVYETPFISLDYTLIREDSDPITYKGKTKDAYFSREELRLYKSSAVDLFSIYVAKELSKLFTIADNEVFPFLASILGVLNQDELIERLRQYNIDPFELLPEVTSDEIEITPPDEEIPDEEKEPATNEEPELEPTTGNKPHPPKSAPNHHNTGLINPEEYFFDEKDEFTPYTSHEGNKSKILRTIKLNKGIPNPDGKKPKPINKPYRVDAEDIALGLVMRFEEMEGRYPDDRHKQSGIGYDILSSSGTGDDKYIEVKHFRGDLGIWELTPHEWKKAEEEQGNYFVYIVSGLRKENFPIIRIIQDPVKYLTYDPPAQKKFSTWQNGIIQIIKCNKI
ncbi:DUF3883 domain-containing protein [Chloroflexota bacterium]